AEGAVEALRRRRGRAVERERDQHGPLALDEVVACRLAGLLRVTEDPEEVVAELERLAEREPEAGELLDLRGGRAGEPGTDVERPLDGVLRGLVAQDGHRGVDVGTATGLDRHVEELSGDDLAAAQLEEGEAGS